MHAAQQTFFEARGDKLMRARTRKAIIADIHDWVDEIVSKPHPDYNGLAPCPFAQPAMRQGKVRIEASDDLATLHCLIREFVDSDLEVAVWAVEDYDDSATFARRIELLNVFLARHDIHLLGIHPDDDDEIEEAGPETPVHESHCAPYALVFVQRLSGLVEASRQLHDAGYYDLYSEDDLERGRDRSRLAAKYGKRRAMR